MKIITNTIFIVTALLCNNLFSQFTQGSVGYNAMANIKSPQVSEFIKYGNIPINSYIGEAQVEIPLYSINTRNKPVSISLGYNSSGFLPNKRPDMVGLDWHLNVGGIISRTVNTAPDDQIGASATNGGIKGQTQNGFIVGLTRKKQCLPLYLDNDIFTFQPNVGMFKVDLDFYLKGCNNEEDYEGNPDIFNFNFDGKRGKFFMTNNGEFKVVSESAKKLKIDISQMSFQPYTNLCKPLASEIKITDDEGNEYYFGGQSKNLEYNISLNANNTNSDSSPLGVPIITSWFLAKAVYKNGEIINYNYRDDSNLTTGFCFNTSSEWHGGQTSPVMVNKRNFILYNESNLQDFKCTTAPGVGNIYDDCLTTQSSTKVYSLTKKTILDNIQGENFKLVLNYSQQPYKFFNRDFGSFFSGTKDLQLDAIILYDNKSQEINRFSFNYLLKGGTTSVGSSPRLFLDKLTEKNKNPYIFDYNLDSNTVLPSPVTKQLDHWGYYNGKVGNEPSLVYLFPATTQTPQGDEIITSDIRNPDSNFSMIGSLKKITYPTKGSTNFEYEANQYTSRIERLSVNNFMPKVVNTAGIAGGLRVKRIYDTDEANVISNDRNITYENSILQIWPRYVMVLENGFQRYGYFRSVSINSALFENGLINYSKVTENFVNNGKIITEFTNYVSNPDINDINVKVNDSHPLSVSNNNELMKNYIGLFYNDTSIERGKLKSKTVFDNSNNIKKVEEFSYNLNPSRYSNFTSVLHTSGICIEANKLYFYQNDLSKKETTEYVNGTPLKTQTNYFYENDLHQNLTRENTIFPDNSKTESTYSYAHEKGYQLMINNNMISIPIEKQTQETTNGVTKTLSRVETLYPVSLPTPETGNLILPLSVKSYNLDNSPSIEVTYNLYNSNGQIQQYTTKEGVPVTVIWGYASSQPIAKIEGANFSDITPSLITSIVNASNDDNIPPTGITPDQAEQTLITALDTFRKDSTLNGYQITTYTYDPLIGVTSITPPSGIREVYIYDTANRLKEIRQDSKTGNLVKEFKYNYKN
ncbi:hypothetical protein CEY12_11560 [Chryseobacterium sp. T16E-39]|uniref:hypothetical protein n=1 Tax=Chryseobacterium sp. T16E-39 TaxID=2015076 RepID=UPI000B5B4315|nr:hypothetical protein [Chryseobacterium sp. T16E-39]ASK30713.1 hypothetical protein CEY12_11560 [Chryseobacterium sp. T16E-39]